MDNSIRERGSNQENSNYSWLDTTNSADEEDVPRDVASSDSDTFLPDDHSVDGSYTLCTACNDMFENYQTPYECNICKRIYHHSCHVPEITIGYENANWQCTLCYDMDSISKDLGRNGNAEVLNSGTVGLKIAERILLELYCSGDASDPFIEEPHPNIFPSYSENVVQLSSLNAIRNRLHTRKHLYKLSEFINDTKKLFANNMSFYDIGDPNFDAAMKLLTNLKNLNSKWVAPGLLP